jgi:hypothetical protein
MSLTGPHLPTWGFWVAGSHVNLVAAPRHSRSSSALDAIVTIPFTKMTEGHGKSPFLIGKPSISMGHFPWRCLTRG